MAQSYYEQQKMNDTLKLRQLLSLLPPYVKYFFRGRETTTSARTRISYAYDLNIFFQFLKTLKPELEKMEVREIPIEILDQITILDMEEFQDYLKVYTSPITGKLQTNGERGIARKLSAVRSLFTYLYKRGFISHNSASLIEMPKLHEKSIVKLDQEEIGQLLHHIRKCGEEISSHQKSYYEKTKIRDVALITLLLGTGIRVSECIGLDLKDVDFKNNGIHITRKGGNEMVVYFGNEVKDVLEKYIEIRKEMPTLSGHENALFLSLQKKRICVDSVEKLVKKYTQPITDKKITPHKFRSTYGTILYKNTGDIYLVADVLGHKDVNTTKKHYAAIEDARRRSAASAVQLIPDQEGTGK